jgi:hypothetical protein
MTELGTRRWVCSACGKTAGSLDEHRIASDYDRGWDESCSMHAVFCEWVNALFPDKEGTFHLHVGWAAVDDSE